MMELISQIFIVIFGGLGIYLIGSKKRKYRLLGFSLGLVSQPFWFYTSWNNGQVGVFLMAFWYTIAWIRGIINNKKEG